MLSIIIISLIILSTLILGLLVFLNNPRDRVNQLFLIMIFWIVVWQLSNFLQNEQTAVEFSNILLRLDFMSAILVGYSWIAFCLRFPKPGPRSLRFLKTIILLLGVVFAALSFTDLIINDIHFQDGAIRFQEGVLWIFYILTLVSFFTWAFCNLLFKLIKLRGIERVQTLYVLIGSLISSLIAIVVNILFSNVVTIDQSRIGIYGIIFFILFTAYAIIKHQLLNIKVIAVELFAVLLVIITFLEIFTAASTSEIFARVIIFIVTLVFSILLIRSVLKEIKRREEIEELAAELAQANKRYEKINKKLQKANVELKHLDDAKSEFISIASHQLRTPLTAIKGYGSMLLEGDFGELANEKQQKAIKIMAISSDRLTNLVENLLNISRIESGRMKFDFKPGDLNKLARDVHDSLKKNAEDRGLYLKFKEPEEALPPVEMDDEKIRQVVINFIDNAIKYTKKGGITVSVFKKGDHLECCVADTGMGVSQEEQSKLFKKFARGKDAFLINTEGNGLGLYVANMMVEAHKGHIWIESEGEDKGSKFCFSLPLADSETGNKLVEESKKEEERRVREKGEKGKLQVKSKEQESKKT
ncbi:hypothetical protein COT99_04275 [Candidatus Falkowbacteria bacterium CG10_big_fil_rev_8_21_14_0_10_43_10]|uniref:histidine kinase n=1 Tax=Candidatus Falkowbacteria bacterium CG10_big_fil_rev_8_21_14_0_10_43_10 TaxID=1974567 RepID=A0A2H0V143_9BACT|nr:MAG: hypothetical protein COT99_04275 [Candidatus Falkowbacteria bacterium CG10_big_fil_rev_8_21_14_0_10_43_10]